MDPATPRPSDLRPPVMTDQALVAVHLGEGLAGGTAGDRPPNVAHLVAGLAAEPDGMAGTLLRQRFGEAAPRIALHDAVGAAALVPLRAAYVAVPVVARPTWTLELLAAARRVGGEDLDHLLESCGVSLSGVADELEPRMPEPAEVDERVEDPETFGRLSLLPSFTSEADLAIARTRARGGDSRELLRWLPADEQSRAALAQAPGVELDDVVRRAALLRSPAGGGQVGAVVRPADLLTAITHLSLRAALDGR